MISKKVFALLEANDFSHGAITVQDGVHIIEIGWYSPAGEDFYATIWFNGSNKDFVKRFAEYADEFSVDEHVSLYAASLGQNGVPSTYLELVEDAQAIQKALRDMAAKLRGDDLPTEPEFCTMMSLSTAHVRPDTMKQILNGNVLNGDLPCYKKINPLNEEEIFGAFVCMGDISLAERNAMPADLAQIWDYCHQHDIWWVMFDRDAPMCSKFTDFRLE